MVGVFSQITLEIGQWYSFVYYFQNIILAKAYYKIYNIELLAIVKVFKNRRYHLENCQHKVLVLIDYNNLYWVIDIKNRSFYQVC